MFSIQIFFNHTNPLTLSMCLIIISGAHCVRAQATRVILFTYMKHIEIGSILT